MSPILDMQQRLVEVGRIRLGQQVAISGGKTRPAKLDRFRLTSKNERAIRDAAELYGGEVQPWESPDGGQWEVVTDATELPVIVPPGPHTFSQWYELWSGGGCQRRCNGVTDFIADGPCSCDPNNRECKTTSRLSVMLPDVRGFGVWRVETHGYYAATELAGVVALCQHASANGELLPARLRLEQRTVKRIDKGKPVTLKFAVPVLDLEISPAQLTTGTTWQPVPVAELPEAPAPSVGEQLAELETPKPRRARANAAEPIRPTGIEPRTAAEAETPEPEPTEGGGPTDARLLLKARKLANERGVAPPLTAEEARAFLAEPEAELPPVSDIAPATRRKLFALAGEMWPDESDDRRRDLVLELAAELGSPGLKSRTEIGQELASRMIDALTEMVDVTR